MQALYPFVIEFVSNTAVPINRFKYLKITKNFSYKYCYWNSIKKICIYTTDVSINSLAGSADYRPIFVIGDKSTTGRQKKSIDRP